MQKKSLTNKITSCCNLPYSVMKFIVDNLTLNSDADRNFIKNNLHQNGTISIDAWKVWVNSGTLESDASLTKAEFLAWFDCERQPSCDQLKLLIEGYKLGNYDPMEEHGVGWTEIYVFEDYNEKIIKKITDYTGGLGVLPDELNDRIGLYLGNGILTDNKDLAIDFKPETENEKVSFANERAVSFVDRNIQRSYWERKNDNGLILNYDFPNIDDTISGVYPIENTTTQNVDGLIFNASAFTTPEIKIPLKYTASIGVRFKLNQLGLNQRVAEIVDGNNKHLFIQINTANKPYVAIQDATNGIFTDFEVNTVLAQNTFYDIVVCLTAYHINVYVNGVHYEKRRNQESQFLISFGEKIHLNLGNAGVGSLLYGVIKKVTVWDRTLSKQRVDDFSDDIINSMPWILDKINPPRGLQPFNNILQGLPTYYNKYAEPSVIKFKGKYFAYFSIGDATEHYAPAGVAVAGSERLDGGWQLLKDGVVAGGGGIVNGQYVNDGMGNRFMGSYAVVKDDFVYLFGCVDYVDQMETRIYKSSDGVNFTKLALGNFLPPTHKWANMGIYPEIQSDGYYYGIAERLGDPSGIWESVLIRTQNFEGMWQIHGGVISSLQGSPGGMVGGATLLKSKNGKRWMNFYHTGGDKTSGGSLPTRGAYAYSDEAVPLNWTVSQFPAIEMNDVSENLGAEICDQIADTFLIEDGGRTYLYYAVMQNEFGNIVGETRLQIFDGTKEELTGIV